MDEKEYQEQNKKYEKQIYFVKSIILMSFLGAVIFSFPILRNPKPQTPNPKPQTPKPQKIKKLI
jgi:hypothetical protein